MKKVIIIFILLRAFTVSAQYDTVIRKCNFSDLCNVERFYFEKPTFLIVKYLRKDTLVSNGYFHFQDGKLNGPYSWVTKKGICVDSGSYKNGLKDGIIKGWYQEDGHLGSVGHYKDGKLDGELRQWGWDRKLKSITNYIDNLKSGKEILYYDNGQIGVERMYQNDTLIDSVHTWYSNGEKMKVEFDCDFTNRYGCNEIYYNSFEENFGIGKLNFYTSNFYPNLDASSKEWLEQFTVTQKVYYLYENPKDKEPAKYADGSYISMLNNSILEISIGYDVEILLMKQDGDWWQVMVGLSNESGDIIDKRKLWIKKSVLKCDYTPWGKFIQETGFCKILDLKSNPILKSPDINSEKIDCQISDCLLITKVEGEWAYVTLIPASDCMYGHSNICFKGGWIKWRNKNQLLIKRS